MLTTLRSVVTDKSCLNIKVIHERKEVYGRASEASSASLKRPGRNQVIDLREDSNADIVDTLFIRKASYLAFEVAIG
jgi:hypothetical protein